MKIARVWQITTVASFPSLVPVVRVETSSDSKLSISTTYNQTNVKTSVD